MEIYKLLEEIESILKSAKTIPFSKQSLVDADNIIKLIGEVRVKLPEELKQAKWIKEERDRIIAEAEKDADNIVKEAENRIISMIDSCFGC